MKYGIFSDSHDHPYNLSKAVEIIKERGITTCFHLGDFCAPIFIKGMVAYGGIKWICVWGNVDGAKAKAILDLKDNPNFDIVDESFREVEVPEGKLFLVHFPELAKHAAMSGLYKAVFYGHNHQKKVEKLENGTLLANPGELAGFATGQPSFGIWDSEANEFEIVDLTDFRTTKV